MRHCLLCSPDGVSLSCRQAEEVKSQLLAQRAYWRLNGPVTDAQVEKMLAEAGQVEPAPALHRGPGRLPDDVASD